MFISIDTLRIPLLLHKKSQWRKSQSREWFWHPPTSVHNVYLFSNALLWYAIIRFKLHFQLKKTIFFSCLWTIWVKLQSVFDTFSNGRLIASLNDLCTASAKRLVEQIFINKIWKVSLVFPCSCYLVWRSYFQNMFTSRYNCFVTFCVDDTFSDNFQYMVENFSTTLVA